MPLHYGGSGVLALHRVITVAWECGAGQGRHTGSSGRLHHCKQSARRATLIQSWRRCALVPTQPARLACVLSLPLT